MQVYNQNFVEVKRQMTHLNFLSKPVNADEADSHMAKIEWELLPVV